MNFKRPFIFKFIIDTSSFKKLFFSRKFIIAVLLILGVIVGYGVTVSLTAINAGDPVSATPIMNNLNALKGIFNTTTGYVPYDDGTKLSNSGIFNSSGNIGIGTTTPEFKLSLDNDGAIIAKGTYGNGATLTTSGAGARLIWYPNKAAFRVGYVANTEWDNANIGPYSIAMGENTTASGMYSTALGKGTVANGNWSTAMGGNTTASGDYSAAMSTNTTASGSDSTAMGFVATASGGYSTAMGFYTTAQADASLVIGQYNVVSGSLYSWVATDPVFVIGNGTGTSATSNAMTVLKNGDVTIAGALTQNSDIRLKDNIQKLGYGLDEILKLDPVSYSWKKYPEEKDRQIGLIAQDVRKVLPELVKGDGTKDDLLSLDYVKIVPVLINAIKEQQKEIEELKAKINN